MEHNDTIELLKECDAGTKMGVNSIDAVLDHIHESEFSRILNESKEAHQAIGSQIHKQLNEQDESGKEPNPMARGMSWMKTNFMLSANDSDHTAADLITDGCNMGVKTLNRYLNQYQAADDESKKLCRQLIDLEENLAKDIRQYL